MLELVVVFSSKKMEEARAAPWWKLGLENWIRRAGLAIPSFLNEFPAFDTRIAQNSKLETHLGYLVETEPETPRSSMLGRVKLGSCGEYLP